MKEHWTPFTLRPVQRPAVVPHCRNIFIHSVIFSFRGKGREETVASYSPPAWFSLWSLKTTEFLSSAAERLVHTLLELLSGLTTVTLIFILLSSKEWYEKETDNREGSAFTS